MIDREDYYMFVDVGSKNSNKFWHIIQEGSSLTTKWGRVGDSPQSKTWDLGSTILAEKTYHKKCIEKTRKGYEKVEAIGKSTCEPIAKTELAQVALREINCDSPITQELIKYLSEQNIHEILEHTTMKYNSVEGVFTTPLGVVVGQNTIDKARNILANIKAQTDLSVLPNLTNQYLRLVPQNLGRARNKLSVERIWDLNNTQAFLLKIQQQADLLDSLEASLKTVLTSPPQTDIIKEEVERPKVFDCKLQLVNDSGIMDEIEKFYKSTWKQVHQSSKFEIKKIYSVDIFNMKKDWKEKGISVGNIKRLWHGTRSSNVLSILKKGLIIPPSNANYVAGRMYGDGIYFSDQSTKSLNYSSGYWHGGTKYENAYMFLADVSLGKSFIPTNSYGQSYPVKGYDSTFAQGGKSGVINNEYIVYKIFQSNLVYLIEFGIF